MPILQFQPVLSRFARPTCPPGSRDGAWQEKPFEPFREPKLDFVLRQNPASRNIGQALRDLLLDVQVILNILERRIVWKLVEELLDFLFGCLHDLPPCLKAYGSPKWRWRKVPRLQGVTLIQNPIARKLRIARGMLRIALSFVGGLTSGRSAASGAHDPVN